MKIYKICQYVSCAVPVGLVRHGGDDAALFKDAFLLRYQLKSY
jgi:hypothetical protein